MNKYDTYIKFIRLEYPEYADLSDTMILHNTIRNYNECTDIGFHVHLKIFQKYVEHTGCDVFTYNGAELLVQPRCRIALDTFFVAPYVIIGNVLQSTDLAAHTMICMCGGLDEYLYSIVKKFWDKFLVLGIVRIATQTL